MTQGNAPLVVLERIEHASRKAEREDNMGAAELEWLAGVVKKMIPLNNHQFFQRISERRDAEVFLRWCLSVMKGSPDFDWVCSEAEKVYSSPTSHQPNLLEIVGEFK